jgi:hypothetical protein
MNDRVGVSKCESDWVNEQTIDLVGLAELSSDISVIERFVMWLDELLNVRSVSDSEN